MKRPRMVWFVAVVIAGVLALALGCGNPLTQDATPRPKGPNVSDSPPLSTYEPQVIGGEDTPLSVPLLAGKTINVGTVEVWLDGESLYVRYNCTWALAETHLEVVTDPEDFPQTKKGNPIPGHFTYKMSHPPGTFEHTYSIDMTEFGEVETLYFAAQAEVEHWVDGSCAGQESAWADGMDFPGANWATYFEGMVPAPIDLTGWWDFYLKLEGIPELGPAVFCILQEDSELDCSLGFAGTITGNTIHFKFSFEGTLFEFDAIVSEGKIRATTDFPPFGSIELRWQPTAVTFSHLDMEGTAQGIDIDFSTDFAVAQSEGVSYMYTHTFDVGLGYPRAHFFILSNDMIPDNAYTVTDGSWEEDFHLSLQLWDGTENWTATSGTVWIDSYNEFGMSGYFTDVYFPDVPGGGILGGTFDAQFDQNTGFVTVNGNWAGSPVDIELTTAGSYRNVSSSRGCWVNIEDHQLNAGVWLQFPGELPPSLPWTYEDMPSVRYAFVDEGTGFYDLMAESGSVTLNTFSEAGASGSFVANFHGGESVSGNFDLIFVEGYGIDLPGGP